jgi:hypothetical protein
LDEDRILASIDIVSEPTTFSLGTEPLVLVADTLNLVWLDSQSVCFKSHFWIALPCDGELLVLLDNLSTLLEYRVNLCQIGSQALCQALKEFGGPTNQLVVHHEHCRLHQELHFVNKY